MNDFDKTICGKLPPDICPLEDCPPNNCPQAIAPRTNALEENCPPGKSHPHHKISPENRWPQSSKFPSKSTTRKLRKTMDC